MSKVTVIIPTYNRAYILSQAIESALAQTMGDFELIIVDDGSADGTAEVVRGFSDWQGSVTFSKQMRAPGRQEIVASQRPRLSTFHFSTQMTFGRPINSRPVFTFLNNHPEVGGIFHDLEWRCGDEVRPSFIRAHSARMLAWLLGGSYAEGTVMPDRELYLMLLQELPIKPTALIVGTLAFKKSGGFYNFPSSEDWEFMLRFAKHGRLAYLDRPLGVIRITPDSVHMKETGQNFAAVCEFLSKQRSLISSQDTEALAAISAGITNAATNTCRRFLARGKRLAAINACLVGFAKTGNVELLLRALGACLPISLFQAAKTLMGQRAEG